MPKHFRPFQFAYYFYLGALPLLLLYCFLAHGPLRWAAGFLFTITDTALLAIIIFQLLRTKRIVNVSRAPIRPRIGVLIASRNEGPNILNCLAALSAQSEAADVVCLVDDGSTDGSADLALAAYPHLEVIKKAHTGKADSLNQAWPKMNCELILTLDADTLLTPDALRELRTAFAHDPELVAAGGLLEPVCEKTKLLAGIFDAAQKNEYARDFLSRSAWMRQDSLLLVSGAFGVYRKTALHAVNGYDTTSLVEDYDLVVRLYRYAFEQGKNWRIGVIPQASARTDAPNSSFSFLKQRERWFAGFLLTLFANWDMLGNSQFGRIGFFMLPIYALQTLQPFYGLASLITLLILVIRSGNPGILILAVFGLKRVLDLAFLFWSIHLFHRWQGRQAGFKVYFKATALAFLEPVFFQPLRYVAAIRGWLTILRAKNDWVPLAQLNTKRMILQTGVSHADL